uniref:Uncharacterized protein n=1 Tax=Arundo donax TaxID=35708 RepID=A0A0A9F1V6_ARUDO
MPRLLPALCCIPSISATPRFSFPQLARLRDLSHLPFACFVAESSSACSSRCPSRWCTTSCWGCEEEDRLLLQVAARHAGWVRRQRTGHGSCSDRACVQWRTWSRLTRIVILRCGDHGRRLEKGKKCVGHELSSWLRSPVLGLKEGSKNTCKLSFGVTIHRPSSCSGCKVGMGF